MNSVPGSGHSLSPRHSFRPRTKSSSGGRSSQSFASSRRIAVVEGELVVADHGHAGGEVDVAAEALDLLLVRPRAHQHPVRDAVADLRELAQVRAGVGIEPAALLEDRHRHRLGAVVEPVPVLVVLLVLPPLAPEADLAPDRHLVELDQGQVAPDAVVQQQLAGARGGDQADRARPDRGRAERQRELERAARPVAVPEVVVVDHLRRDALEIRVPLVHQLPLDERAVAPAPGADPAVAPLLARRPGQGVVSVDAVLAPRLELALRLVAAAHVHDDGGVAALREPDAPADEALARRLVRRPLADRRVRAARERQIDVRRECTPSRIGTRWSCSSRTSSRLTCSARPFPRSASRRSGRRRRGCRRDPRAAAPPRRRSPARSGSGSGSGSRKAG